MLEERIVHLLNQMENLSKQYTPEVFDAAVNVIMMNGLVKILGGLSLILFAALCIFACTKLYVYAGKKYEEDELSDWNRDRDQGVIKIVGSVVVVMLVFAACCLLFDIWNWVAIFNPKLALAKTVLQF